MASLREIERAQRMLLKADVAIANVLRLPLFIGDGDAGLVEAKRLIWITIKALDTLTGRLMTEHRS